MLQECYSSVIGVLQEGYSTVAVHPYLPVKHVSSRFFLSYSVCLQRVGRLTVHAERGIIADLARCRSRTPPIRSTNWPKAATSVVTLQHCVYLLPGDSYYPKSEHE